jgi:hypothetical protein
MPLKKFTVSPRSTVAEWKLGGKPDRITRARRNSGTADPLLHLHPCSSQPSNQLNSTAPLGTYWAQPFSIAFRKSTQQTHDTDQHFSNSTNLILIATTSYNQTCQSAHLYIRPSQKLKLGQPGNLLPYLHKIPENAYERLPISLLDQNPRICACACRSGKPLACP